MAENRSLPETPINDWENPQVVGRNKEPGHATLMPFADQAAALTGVWATKGDFEAPSHSSNPWLWRFGCYTPRFRHMWGPWHQAEGVDEIIPGARIARLLYSGMHRLTIEPACSTRVTGTEWACPICPLICFVFPLTHQLVREGTPG